MIASQEDVLTPFNTPRRIELDLSGFGAWLTQAGASEVTARNYCRAVEKWHAQLLKQPGVSPARLWLKAEMSPATSRLTGYACRRYADFAQDVLETSVNLGVPRRLPAVSAPAPQAITQEQFGQLLRAAKALLPTETSYSFRCWLRFLDETAARRGESIIGYDQINWHQHAVSLVGKSGERDLPLSPKMIRRLSWLRRRNPDHPWCGHRGQPLGAGSLYNLFKRVAARCDLAHLRPHHFRHHRLTRVCRSHLAKNQLLVLAFAGHRHVGSLQPYYHVSIDEKRELLNSANPSWRRAGLP